MHISSKQVILCVTGLGLAGTAFWYDHAGRAVSVGRGPSILARLESWEDVRADEPQEAQNFYVLKRMPRGVGPLDYSLYKPAINHVNTMSQYSIATGTILPPTNAPIGNWTFLGPGNVGGRTRGLVIDPTNTQIMYSAAVAGGVWKTTNGGGTWTASADFLANIAVNSLVMDPNNHLVLYAGTGEGYFNGDALRGNGIYKTVDGGANWTQLLSTNNNADFYYVNKLAINAASSRIYAATRTGVFRSTDGGSTWTKTLEAAAVNGCMDVKVQTDRPLARVIAACGTFASAFISRALDNSSAQTWTTVFSPANMGRTSLALAPSNQSTIYALSASNTTSGNYQQGLLAVYRSQDNGTTWTTQVDNTNPTLLNTLLLTNPIEAELTQCGFGTSTFAFTQGWYDNIIAVDPINPNTVWVGGIDLFRSTDGGQNWGLASYWWAPTNNAVFSHADHHALVFDPNYNGTTNQILYDGNDGGIFRTSNAAAGNVGTTQGNICGNPLATNPVSWSTLNNSYGVTQYYFGVPFPDGTTYFGGSQDNGTTQGSDAGGPGAWKTVLPGDGGAVAVNPANTNMAWAENTRLSIVRTVNGWLSSSAFTSGITESSGNFLFIAPFTQDPSNPNNMWTGGATIWRTTQATANPTVGNIWTAASTFLSERVASLAVAPTDSNTVYVGMSNSSSPGGIIYHNTSALAATSATVWASATPRTGYVSAIAVDPTTPSTAWAVYSTFGGNHVWKTTNTGVSWSAMDGTAPNNIPDIPVHTIAINPSNNQKLYIGTDLGVFVSVDGGVNWMVENNLQLPNVSVDWLTFNTTGTIQLFAFTHGRSAWKVTPN